MDKEIEKEKNMSLVILKFEGEYLNAKKIEN